MVPMEDARRFDERFRPLRPASGVRLVLAIVLGPVLWLASFAIAAVLLDRTDAIEFGLLVTAASILVSFLVLASSGVAGCGRNAAMSAAELLLVVRRAVPRVTAASGSRAACSSVSSTKTASETVPAGGWPGVTVLIPAYNEER